MIKIKTTATHEYRNSNCKIRIQMLGNVWQIIQAKDPQLVFHTTFTRSTRVARKRTRGEITQQTKVCIAKLQSGAFCLVDMAKITNILTWPNCENCTRE